ncbi:PDZ domain-containing protein [Candidatus Parcubacteria bacterium]|nr:MAG: PDZ domain-containing protein [Candidatus Parcubacteria bacterium]
MKEQSPIIETIKKVMPAVVSVMISKHLSEQDLEQIIAYGKSFGLPFGMKELKSLQGKRVRVGGGSGFFVSPDGLILTNKHVVADPDAEYAITTTDHKRFKGLVLARDPINDVAILKIQDANQQFPYLELGNSTDLELGQTVVAVGNALGEFQNTVSTGIVSGLSRYIMAQDSATGHEQKLRGLIQTDAAINPGNSGGPLTDLEAKVIGINTAVIFGAQNIGFAIPVNTAKKDLESVKQFGRLRVPFFGVRHITITPAIQKEFKLPISSGAFVISEHVPGDFAVVPDSPAERAGVEEGDVILEFNGQKISKENPLEYCLAQCDVNQQVNLKIWHAGQEKVVTAVLTERK